MNGQKSTAPLRASIAETVHARRSRRARLDAAARLNWQFWRWRPKVSLCTLQIFAFFIGSIVLVQQRSQPWRPSMTLGQKTFPLAAVAFSGDGKTIMTAGNDGTTRLYDAETGAPGWTVDHRMMVNADLSPDGKWLAVSKADGSVDIWDVTKHKLTPVQRPGNTLEAGIVKFSPDSSQVAVALTDSRWIGVFQIPKENEQQLPAHFQVGGDSTSSVKFSQDGQRIVTSSVDGLVRVWGPIGQYSAQLIAAIRGDVNTFRSAVFSPDGKFVATACKDSTVRLWNACGENETRSILDPAPPEVNAHGNNWVARPLAVMKGHQQYVLAQTFSPDGERLATVSLDGCVRVWGGRDGRELAMLTPSSAARMATFSPDGKRLAAAGSDGTVQIWDRRCSERWYGKLLLPEFWLMIVLLPILIWSVRRDARSLGLNSAIVGIESPFPSTAPKPINPAADQSSPFS